LPEDGSANGFDNAGAALHTSSFLMERYLDAAETALDLAISKRLQPPPMIKQHEGLKDPRPGKKEIVHRVQDETVICFCSSPWHSVSPRLNPQEAGYYRFRISASAVQSAGKPVTFRVTHGRTRLSGQSGLVGYFDAPPGEPRVFEFVQYSKGKHRFRCFPTASSRQERSTRSASTSTKARAWRFSGSKLKGRSTTFGRRKAIGDCSAT
jgi:hypothetical protein